MQSTRLLGEFDSIQIICARWRKFVVWRMRCLELKSFESRPSAQNYATQVKSFELLLLSLAHAGKISQSD